MKFCRATLGYQRNIIICGFWFFGLLLGLWISSLSQSGFPQYDNVLVSYRISLFGVLLTVIVPLTTVIIAITLRLRWLTWLIIFIEAFRYGFSFYHLTCLIGPVFRSVLMFANSISTFLVLIICFRFDSPKNLRNELLYIFVFAILICLFDSLIGISLFYI